MERNRCLGSGSVTDRSLWDKSGRKWQIMPGKKTWIYQRTAVLVSFPKKPTKTVRVRSFIMIYSIQLENRRKNAGYAERERAHSEEINF